MDFELIWIDLTNMDWGKIANNLKFAIVWVHNKVFLQFWEEWCY